MNNSHAMQPLGTPEDHSSSLDALDTAMRALDDAEQGGQAVNVSLALAEVGLQHRRLGMLEPAEWYTQQALRWARTLGAPDTSIDLLCELADLSMHLADEYLAEDVDRARAAHDRARDHAYEAANLAQQRADPECEVSVLMRVSETLDACGDHDDALSLQCRALELIMRPHVNSADATTGFQSSAWGSDASRC